MKECGLSLWDCGWEVEDICETLGFSHASLYRWRQILEQYGTVIRPPSPLHGRPRILTQAIIDALHHLLIDLYLDESRAYTVVASPS